MRCASLLLIVGLLAGCTGLPKAGESMVVKGVDLISVEEAQDPVALMLRKIPSGPMEESAYDAKTRQMLEGKMLEAVDFKGESLEVVLNFVRDQTGVNMVLLWGSIEAAGVRRDRAVNLQLKQVSVAQVLKSVLEQVSSDLEEDGRLGYDIENGIVMVTTRRELKLNTVEWRYDIRDLLVQAPNFMDASSFTLNNAAGGGGGGGGRSCTFDETAAAAQEPDSVRMVEELVTRLKEQVGTRAEWDDNFSIISSYQSQLLVKTTRKNHRALAVLLDSIRQQRFLTIAMQARVLRMPVAVFEQWAEKSHGTLELRAADVRALMQQATAKNSPIQLLAMGRQRCMNMQRTYVLGDGQKSYVMDVSAPSLGSRTLSETKETTEAKDGTKTIKEEKKSEDPVVAKGPALPHASWSTLQEGLVVDFEATASADHRQVLATVRSDWAGDVSLRTMPVAGGEKMEMPGLCSLQWRTTTTIPNGGAVLLTASTPAKDGQNAMETVLLLQATVVEPKAK